jgi:hypothetical protein
LIALAAQSGFLDTSAPVQSSAARAKQGNPKKGHGTVKATPASSINSAAPVASAPSNWDANSKQFRTDNLPASSLAPYTEVAVAAPPAQVAGSSAPITEITDESIPSSSFETSNSKETPSHSLIYRGGSQQELEFEAPVGETLIFRHISTKQLSSGGVAGSQRTQGCCYSIRIISSINSTRCTNSSRID